MRGRCALLLLVLASGFGEAKAQPPLPALPLSRMAAADRALVVSAELQARLVVEEQARAGAAVPHLFNPQVRLEAEGDRAGFGTRDYLRRLSVEQELDLRGERAARKLVGATSVEFARTERLAREQEIRLDVEGDVGQWMILRRRGVLLDSLSRHAERQLSAARLAVRRETLTPFTERQLGLDVAQLESERQLVAGALAAQEVRLRTLLAWPAGEPLSFSDDLDRAEWRCNPESLVVLALQYRRDWARVAAEESLHVARLNLERRLGQVNPTIGASIARERTSFDRVDFAGRTGGPDGLAKSETRWGVSIAVPLPLSSPHQPEIAEAAAGAARATAERQALATRIRADVAAECAIVSSLQYRLVALAEPARGATDDLGRIEAAYRDGRISLQEYLTFRERLVDAGRRYFDALEALEHARADLARTLGLDLATLNQRLARP